MNRLIALLFLGASLVSAQADPLIATNSTWKYFKGTSEASSPSSAWRTNGFNDTNWLSGPGPFYYENDPTSATAYTGNTALTDMYGGYSSVFLRQKFVITNVAQIGYLQFTADADDGYIVWINGTEVVRFNMPAGNQSFSGTAMSSIAEPPPIQNFFLLNPTNLVSGTNQLAIEAFNDSKTSSDFMFWAALAAYTNAFSNYVQISEIMVTNRTGIQDQDGEFSPWIELYNPTTNDVSLTNWSLTADSNNLRQWIIPNVTLLANNFMVIFASGKNRATNTAELHTNFRPSVAGGFLALVNPATNIVSSFASYPGQFPDISYGCDPLSPELTGYFSNPTPDNENDMGGGFAAPGVTFSRAGGTFTNTFNLQLTTTSNAVVHYTLDGSAPTEASPVCTADLVISNSVLVRARSFLPGLLPGKLRGATYVQLDAGLAATNSNLPAIVLYNFGAGSVPAYDYQLVNLSIYEPTNGVTSLAGTPTLSARAGIHEHGSSTINIAKHSYSVNFWDEANQDDNHTPLGMPSESDFVLYAPNQFEPVMVHNPLMYELSNEMGRYAPRTRYVEVYLNQAGGPLTAADYVGVYVLEEKIKWDDNRVNITKIRSVDELHPLDNTGTNLTGGYMIKLDRLGLTETGFSGAGQTLVYDHPNEPDMKSPQRAPQQQYLQTYMNSFNTALNAADYTNLNGGFRTYVDVPSWVDIHILNTMTMNPDGLRLSSFYYKDRNDILRAGPIWDYDRTMGSSDGRDFTPLTWRPTSAGTDFFNFPWWTRMFKDTNFFQAWIDRYQDLRVSQLSTNNVFGLIDTYAAQVTQQQPRDVARWPTITTPRSGLISSNGYSNTFSGTYQGEVAFIKKWLTDRFNFMDTNFVARPVFSKSGLYLPGDTLTLTSPNGGTNYYTTNGTDPRLPGGGVSTNALVYSTPITLSANLTVTARAYNGAHHNLTGSGNPPISSSWSGPLISTFAPGAVPVITQSPVDLDAYLGQTIVFTVQTTGNPAPGYQWQHQGITLANQTNTMLSFLLTNNNQTGAYSVIVTNLVGTNSASWNLNITPKPNLVITEAESSESKGTVNSTLDHLDWWELSNLGSFPVNLRGYRFDDSHASLAVAETLTNNVIIAPGESVVLVEDMTPAQFRNWWGTSNLPPNLQIITYPNIGFSSSGDAIYVWNAAATNNADTVTTATFPAATRGVTFGYNPDTGVFGALSAAGNNGAFAAATNADVGSPGTIINLPRLSQVQINGTGGFGFNLVTQPNRNYQIQYKDDLTAADWQPLTNFTAAGNSFTLADPVGGTNAARYYRVLVTP